MTFFIKDIDALLFEAGITHRGDLIGQINVKVKGHADGKGELGLHATGVGFDRQLEVLADFGELLDPLLHRLRVTNPVDAADETGVLPPCHAPLKSTTEGQRPGDAAKTGHLALIGRIHAPQQAKQGGFARPVDSQNTNVAIPRQFDAYIAQHIVAAKLGGVVLGYIVENDHVIPHSLAINWRSAGDDSGDSSSWQRSTAAR